MVNSIELRLARLLDDEGTQRVQSPASLGIAPAQGELKTSPFEDILSKAVDSLDGVSKQEIRANQLMDSYLKGEVGIEEVMIETSKMKAMIELAVTTINSAVATFKELTQMQI